MPTDSYWRDRGPHTRNLTIRRLCKMPPHQFWTNSPESETAGCITPRRSDWRCQQDGALCAFRVWDGLRIFMGSRGIQGGLSIIFSALETIFFHINSWDIKPVAMKILINKRTLSAETYTGYCLALIDQFAWWKWFDWNHFCKYQMQLSSTPINV